jgi:hypothetical protein
MRTIGTLAVVLLGAVGAVGCGGGSGDAAADATPPEDAGRGPDAREAEEAGAVVEASLVDTHHADDAATHDAGRGADAAREGGFEGGDEGVSDAGHEAEARALITIRGSVDDQNGDAVVFRAVNVLDAAGVSHVALTDSTGKFSVPGVAAPYDVAVTGFAGSLPVAYLHLETAAPRLWSLSSAAAPSESVATMNLTISLPDCGGECSVYIAPFVNGVSATGGPVINAASLTTVSRSLGVDWPGSGTTTAGVHVLVANAALSSFWYHLASATLSPSAIVSFGTVTPSTISTASTLTLTPREHGDFSAYSPATLQVGLELPGGGAAQLASLETTALTTGIPAIVGATVSLQGYTQIESEAGIESSGWSLAQKANLPLSSTSAVLSFYQPATWKKPALGGSGDVALGSTLSWAIPRGAPDGFDFLEIASGVDMACFAFTSEDHVSLASLEKLGVSLNPGAFAAYLSEYRPHSSLDKVLEAGAAFRVVGRSYGAPSVEGSTIHGVFTP